MVRVQEMGESNMLGVSGREDGEMSWKEANTGSGRDKKERNQWKGVKKKKYGYQKRMWKLGKKHAVMGDGEREEGKLEKWAGRYQRRPKVYEKVTDGIPLPNGAEILPHLALSFPQVLGSSKVRGKGETQCQPIMELWIPTSSKELSVLLSMVRHPHSPLSIPTLFHPPFGQLTTWYRQASPLEEER